MSDETAEPTEIFTDGACLGNPGPGGWGVMLRWRGHEKELFGGQAETTNNRMELMAAIQGLEALTRGPSGHRCGRLYRQHLCPEGHHRMDCQMEAERLAHGGQEAGQERRPVAAPGGGDGKP